MLISGEPIINQYPIKPIEPINSNAEVIKAILESTASDLSGTNKESRKPNKGIRIKLPTIT
jgi:hypothetical protein